MGCANLPSVDAHNYSFESDTARPHRSSSPLVSLPDLLASHYQWPAEAIRQQLTARRHPVLAIGSNAGVEQLHRKYAPSMFPHVLVPVVQCILEDFDVVYAPLLAGYGSATATLEHSPGTAVQLHITFLHDAQLERMHATEGTYFLVELAGVTLHEACSITEPWPAHRVDHAAWLYLHQNGSFYPPSVNSDSPTPIAIAEIGALHRRFPSHTQAQMLDRIKGAYDGPLAAAYAGLCLDAWVHRIVTRAAERHAIVQWLAGRARPLAFPRATVLEAIDGVDAHVEAPSPGIGDRVGAFTAADELK